MTERIYPARKLCWDTVCALIENQIERILGRRISCKAWPEDDAYWCVSAVEHRFSIAEIDQLLNAVSADATVREEAMPIDSDSSHSFGMELCKLLLRAELNASWERGFHTAQDLWLVNYVGSAVSDSKFALHLPDVTVKFEDLKTHTELIDYLTENGPTHSSLMDFCDSYRKRYRNELCWSYPISDGKHMGTFIIPVREGILSLPYDEADKANYERFCLEDVRMFRAADMEEFMDSWETFSSELKTAMQSMRAYLLKREDSPY